MDATTITIIIDAILKILGAIGGAAGIISIIYVFKYSKQEKRTRTAQAQKEELDVDEKIQNLRSDMDSVTQKLGLVTQENIKLRGKFDRLVQIIKMSIETRASVIKRLNCAAECVAIDASTLAKIEELKNENGAAGALAK